MRRGSTLIETMVAGAVLVLGMVGILQLLIMGVSQFGRANARATGQDLSVAAVSDVMALPFDAVPAGAFDAGEILIDGKRYGRVRTVTDIDGGTVRARMVTVTTDWRENLGSLSLPRTSRATIIISEVPDAG